MRRLFDALIATALLIVPALAITATVAPAATVAAASHYTALYVSPNSGLAPGDPGTL